MKTLIVILAAFIALTGCATNQTPLAEHTVTLKEPVHIRLSRSYEEDRYVQVTTVRGKRRGKFSAEGAVLWLHRGKAVGMFSNQSQWLPVSDISRIQNPERVGHDLMTSVITTAEASKREPQEKYWGVVFRVCRGGVDPNHPQDLTSCMGADELSGTGFRADFRSAPNDKPVHFDVSGSMPSLGDRVTVIPAQAYHQERAKILEKHGRYEANEAARRTEEIARERAQEESFAKRLRHAEKGSLASCSTGRFVHPTTEQLSRMVFECATLGTTVMYGELAGNGWRTTLVERIPTVAIDGFQGVTVNLMLEKVR